MAPGRGVGMLEQFDRSGDGRITQADVDTVRAERFAAFDANGDGALDLEEFEALWLDTQRRQMTADIAHELRNPLSVIRGNLEAMLDGLYPTDAEEVVEKVRERYGAFATAGTSCCGPAATSCCSARAASALVR